MKAALLFSALFLSPLTPCNQPVIYQLERCGPLNDNTFVCVAIDPQSSQKLLDPKTLQPELTRLRVIWCNA